MRNGPRLGLQILAILAGTGFAALAAVSAWLWFVPAPSLPQSGLLQAVSSVRATAGKAVITVDWDSIPNAVCYQVLRSDNPNGPFLLDSFVYGVVSPIVQHTAERLFPGEPFGRIPHGPWVDTDIHPGRTYYYRVRGNDGGAWSPAGNTIAVTAAPESGETPQIQADIDASQVVGTLEHKWETAIGSEHLSYMLKGDIDAHVKAAGLGLRNGNRMAHDTLGIQYIRAHGIFMDDPAVYTEDAQGHPHYDWSKVDRVYDMLRQDGLKPFVELSFMPAALAANPGAKKIFSYKASSSPPKDYAKWRDLVAALAQHLIDRYGRQEVETWPFEVWNEPDLKHGVAVFWTGNQEDYFRLYDYAAEGVKSVDPNLKVGGPVAAFTTFQEPFLKHVTTQNFATGGNRTPLDFLDLHNYFLPAADYRPLLARYGLPNVPVYFTEWGLSLQYGDEVNDLPYGAAAVVAGIEDSLDQVALLSYWTASDYFEESGNPRAIFHGGFGLIGLDGLRKSRYWAFALLHRMGTGKLAVKTEGDGAGGLVKCLATRRDSSVQVLLSNVTLEFAKDKGDAALGRDVSVHISGLIPGALYRLEDDRIDLEHSNVYGAWQKMGRPRWPDSREMTVLHKQDGLQQLSPPRLLAANDHGEIQLEIHLPMPAVAYLQLDRSDTELLPK
ncbi:GH39 family glycosyl hydrolase [Silvibacterium acidisoli]|uniref:GH39 family glycosyl hydrolase n=1 Tax=Acidobacteriaceae bacterium ZG23-2 TaxID=2883246 RepID=UPI00406C0BC1